MKTLAFAFAFLSMFSVMGRTQPIKQNGGGASASVSTATVILDYNGNATVPYGVVSSSAEVGTDFSATDFITGYTLVVSSAGYSGTTSIMGQMLFKPENAQYAWQNWSQASNGNNWYMAVASGTASAPASVATGKNLFVISNRAHDGTAYRTSSSLEFSVEGSTGPSNMPGKIVFGVAPQGAGGSIERMRLSNTGALGISDTTSDAMLVVKSTTGAVSVFIARDSSANNLLQVKPSGLTIPYVRTKAQIDAITPLTAELGGIVICSDCSAPYAICVATGAALSGFRRSDSTTIGCGTNN